MTAELRLPALSLPGLSPDSLGNYLASLGLLRVLSREWGSVRIAWRDDILRVVGGPSTLDELLDELVRVATSREWTPYERGWSDAQKKGTKAKSGIPLALWQASADERHLELFAAHAVPHARVSFNPLLGSGGNAGRRDFAAGWKKAVDALAAPRAGESKRAKTTKKDVDIAGAGGTDERRSEIHALLEGKSLAWLLGELSAASWFSDANKLYNSGQSPFREGQLSPWAMALACEGLSFLAGGASRRLGARSRAVGAFPFVTKPLAPEAPGEAGRSLGEIWAPLWDRPMTLAEVRALFARGRAEQHGRGALTPAAFASAITGRGIDAGVSGFRRFSVGRTTSANTFEPCFEGVYALEVGDASSPVDATTKALERVTTLIEQRSFPRDQKVGQRWRVAGLRGPIEAALLRVASEPDEPEAAIAMLDAIVAALDRVDRNRSFRKAQVHWQPLPVEWLPSLFCESRPGVEARLALSFVSGFPASLPFAAFRFGVEWTRDRRYSSATKPRHFEHTERPPARWVWGPVELPRVLSAVLARRILEEESVLGRDEHESSGRGPLPATCSHVARWLDGDVDEDLLAAWISRLALFDWRQVPQEVRALVGGVSPPLVDGALGLFGLLQPLVDRRPALFDSGTSRKDLFAPDTGARSSAVARSLVNLVRAGSLDGALRLASSRYSMAGAFLAHLDVPWALQRPERFLASLLFTIPNRDRTILIERWLRPRRRQQGNEAHV